jgi:exopolyphosphatase/guanosine-5'-triphosphate,3'-diphosphate pyrophosphatase
MPQEKPPENKTCAASEKTGLSQNKKVHTQVVEICKKFDPDPSHAFHVSELALVLFDGLRNLGLHQLSEQYRQLLEYGCILHDIGWVDGQQKHHKRSFTMITESALSLTDRQKQLVAFIARFHRKAEPGGQEQFQTLPIKEREAIAKLSAIIRIADVLDRFHNQKVTIKDMVLDPAGVIIMISGEFLKIIPQSTLYKKIAYFNKAFGIPAILTEKSDSADKDKKEYSEFLKK